jgi:Choline/ethanolamine kinase
MVNVYKEIAEWKRHVFGGVDGKNIPEQYLLKPRALEDFSLANLQAACEAMGIDCLNFVFNYTDLGPTNIIVENKPNSRKVRIIDFEIASYFPRS